MRYKSELKYRDEGFWEMGITDKRKERIKSTVGTILFLAFIFFSFRFFIMDNTDGKYFYKKAVIKGKNISFDDDGRNHYHIVLRFDGKTVSRYFSMQTYYSVEVGDKVTLRMYESYYFKRISIRGVFK